MKIPQNPFAEESEDLSGRHNALLIVVVIIFLMLFLRIWYLQIVRGHEYRILSESNRTRAQDILPPRGMILDRNGVVLVDNYPSYELAIVRDDVKDPEGLAAKLAYLVGASYDEIWKGFEEAKMRPAFKPYVILSGLSRENLVALETNRFDLPGVIIQVKPKRRYLHDQLASHIIGYLGEVTQEQLNQEKYGDHRMGDLAGQYGIEREWELILHGRRGRRLVEVDASGRTLKVIQKLNPTPGANLFLTIDSRLQQAAQDALGDQSGAVVALDPNNGEILAMASMPTFNQSDFIDGISPEKWKELLDNPLNPLENKAISGQYPPGSTYKIISAAAALEENAVTLDERLICRGGYPFGNRVFHCWNRGGHGAVDMHNSLKQSCDIYYYEVSRRVGVDNLAKYARMFGLGMAPGVGIGNEKEGLVPTKEWKKKKIGRPWRPGETLPVVIGQGYNLASPLQMAQVVAVAANSGTLYRSHIVKKIVDNDGETVKEYQPEIIHKLNFKPETFPAIRKGLYAVVNEPGGTARRARLEDVVVCGKTGTAQVVSLSKHKGIPKKDLPYKYRDHAWFVAFAPYEKPEIAVAVLVEHGGGGSVAAAPIAKQVIEAYFHPETIEDLIDETKSKDTLNVGEEP